MVRNSSLPKRLYVWPDWGRAHLTVNCVRAFLEMPGEWPKGMRQVSQDHAYNNDRELCVACYVGLVTSRQRRDTVRPESRTARRRRLSAEAKRTAVRPSQ